MTLEARNLARALSIKGEVRVLVGDVSLRLEAGEIMGLTGPSGCGKSTVLRLIMGLDARSAGSVLFDDTEVVPAGLPSFRKQVAMLAQNPSTPEGTPRALINETGADPTPHLEPLGLTARQLDTPWSKLSGGEARRLRLAIIAATGPRFLVLDEPTSGLDADNARRLADFVRAQAEAGRGVLIVSHDELLLARCAGRVQILYEGEVHGEGAPADVMPAAWADVTAERRS